MKFVFLFGGCTGFAVAALTAWAAGRGIERIFFDATVGCLCGAVLFRWFWQVLLRSLRETFLARHRAALAAATSTKPKT